MFDKRLLRIGVEVGKNMVWYEGLQMSASITKVANQVANDATIKITNIAKDQRDYILTETTPWNRLALRKRIVVEAGRESYGYSQIFSGDIINVSVSQPPDIVITFTAKTNAWNNTKSTSRGYSDMVSMRQVASDAAKDMGLTLVFEATDKNIASYSFAGAKSGQISKLAQMGNVNAYIDDDKLIVKNLGAPLKSATVATLDMDSGMVGIPELTEQGIRVKMMFEPYSRCGGEINVRSQLNPGATGAFIIYKMTYDLANRDESFYNTIEAYKKGRYLT